MMVHGSFVYIQYVYQSIQGTLLIQNVSLHSGNIFNKKTEFLNPKFNFLKDLFCNVLNKEGHY